MVLNKGSAHRIGVATPHLDVSKRVGHDFHGWSLNRDGGLWHNNKSSGNSRVTKPTKGDVITVMLNREKGELTFSVNSMMIEFSFKDPRLETEELYPAVGFQSGESFSFV